MKFTKFGVSTALIGALGYFMGYFSLIPMTLLFIFVLYTNLDLTAKKNITQALTMSILFSVTLTVISFCSNGYLTLLDKVFVDIFENYDLYEKLSNLNAFNGLSTIIAILEFVVMIYAVIVAFKGNIVKLPIITKLVNKHFDQVDEKATETVAE